MTHKEHIVELLLRGHYIILSHGRPTLFKEGSIPVQRVKERTFAKIGGLFKKDKKGRHTLNLSLVRGLHGNDAINRAYKKMKNEETGN